MRRLLSIVVLLILMTPAVADAPSGEKILAAMKKQLSSVNDYRADITLTVKGPKISINNMQMTVYYKKPNKIHVEAKQGFAMMPGGNYFGDPLGEMSSAKATYVRTEKKQGRECYLLDVATPQDSMKLWVDRQRSVMVAMEGRQGFKTAWQHEKIDGKYYLPSQISADVQGPAVGHRRHGATQDQSIQSGPTKVTIKFGNYKVNKGIDDKIFEDKKRK